MYVSVAQKTFVIASTTVLQIKELAFASFRAKDAPLHADLIHYTPDNIPKVLADYDLLLNYTSASPTKFTIVLFSPEMYQSYSLTHLLELEMA